jgi:hypothetical protein
MAASQYLEVVETITRSDPQVEDNEEEGLEVLEATVIDLGEFEQIFGLTEPGLEMINRKRSRHSYNYLSLQS